MKTMQLEEVGKKKSVNIAPNKKNDLVIMIIRVCIVYISNIKKIVFIAT